MRIKSIVFAAAMVAAVVGGQIVSLGKVNATDTDGYSIRIPVEKYFKAEPGSVTKLAERSADQEFFGALCSVKATSKNQWSVHPGNNIVVRSADSRVVLNDVEREGGVVTDAQGTLRLADSVVVELVMGKDGASSVYADISVNCKEPEITVCRNGEVITISKSNYDSKTDSDAPCETITVCRDGKDVVINVGKEQPGDVQAPCGEIAICRNGENITVKESTPLTDGETGGKCPTITVCRDGTEVVINKGTEKSSDIIGDCPEVKGVVTELPKTGSNALIITLTAGFIAAATRYAIVRR